MILRCKCLYKSVWWRKELPFGLYSPLAENGTPHANGKNISWELSSRENGGKAGESESAGARLELLRKEQ